MQHNKTYSTQFLNFLSLFDDNADGLNKLEGSVEAANRIVVAGMNLFLSFH